MTARVGSKPSRVTVKPVLLTAAVTLVIDGAAGLITIVFVGAGTGVISCPAASNWVVMVIVPATVPVCTPMVAVELVVISWIRTRYMDTPFLQAAFQVVVGGVLVFAVGIIIGSS